MYEVSTYELMVFVVLGFCAGIFISVYLTRLIEVIHLWRIVKEVTIHLLLMCVTIIEDVAFLKELKHKQMVEADFTPKQIRNFEEVDERTLTNWKDSVILSIVTTAPPRFRPMLPFTSWDEAVRFLQESVREAKNQ